MNPPALKSLLEKLAADEPIYGLWVTLESASISDKAVALGLDWKENLEHIRTPQKS